MKYIIPLFLLLSAHMVQAQSNYDKRLLEKYPESQILELQSSNPEIISYWTYFLDNGYVIADIPAGKENDFTEVVSIKNLDHFNILSLPVGTPGEHPSYYRIQNSQKILVLLSNDDFVKKFKASQGNQ